MENLPPSTPQFFSPGLPVGNAQLDHPFFAWFANRLSRLLCI